MNCTEASFNRRLNRILERQRRAREALGIEKRHRDRIKKAFAFRFLQNAKRTASKPKRNEPIEGLKDFALRSIASGASSLSDCADLIHDAAKKNDGLFLRRISGAEKKSRRKIKYFFDEIDSQILRLWDGCEMLYGYPYPKLPGLKSWSGPAAAKCIAHLVGEPTFSYWRYKQRCRRLGLRSEKEIVIRSAKYVRKFVGRSEDGRDVFHHELVTHPPLETFVKEDDLRERQKRVANLSSAKVTPECFNADNGSGRITAQRTGTRRVRDGQRTPANNSPDLHPIAGAESALSLERIQPERDR